MTAAVFSLLGVTGGVLAAFAALFLRFQKRARAMLLQSEKEAESHG
jgi:maltodextrin utilization protein YvdJ